MTESFDCPVAPMPTCRFCGRNIEELPAKYVHHFLVRPDCDGINCREDETRVAGSVATPELDVQP